MPEGTEREGKERLGQNWTGKNLLPNFSLNIKVEPFVLTTRSQLNKIVLVLITCAPFNEEACFVVRRILKGSFEDPVNPHTSIQKPG